MIITRAPLRISFAGGGTDIPQFYRKYGPGAVVSAAITRYVYVSVCEKFDRKVSVRYRNHESVDRVDDLKHDLIREILLYYGIHDNIEIVVSSEVPARGSGLGASSALAVALCLAIERLTGKTFPSYECKGDEKSQLAETACMIEIEKVHSPIGKQDQYASAFGGLNYFQFNQHDSVNVSQFVKSNFTDELESQSMLFYLNIGHTYLKGDKEIQDRSFVPRILSEQVASIDTMKNSYIIQRDNAIRLKENMEYEVIERFLDHVNENWRIKKSLHPEISNSEIEDFMRRAFKAGASAAKCCGVGGGGFVYLLAQPDMHGNIRKEFASEFPELTFEFDWEGAKILADDSRQRIFV